MVVFGYRFLATASNIWEGNQLFLLGDIYLLQK
jgi:hypothetical protein